MNVPSEYEHFEAEKWDAYFAEALQGHGQEHQNKRWWWLSDRDTLDILKPFIEKGPLQTVLEAGCGSGGSTVRVLERFDLSQATLLDISSNALRFAESLISPSLRNRFRLIQASAFEIPFPDGTFDLTWNVGVVEHYSVEEIRRMILEMFRVTSNRGVMVIGFPNRCSIATLKAWILGTCFGRKYLSFIPGYRFDTEKLYGNRQIQCLCSEVCGIKAEIAFAGSILWVGAPERLVNAFDAAGVGRRLKFLTYVIINRL